MIRGLTNEPVENSWQEALTRGRLAKAYKLYALQDNSDTATLEALNALTKIEVLIRSRSWNQVHRRRNRLESPPEILDWEKIKVQLNFLKASATALDRRNPEEALKELTNVTLPFLQAEVKTQRGTALIFMKNFAGADKEFREALALDPENYRALTNLGNMALEQNRIDEAIESYEKALKLNGDFGNAHHNLGIAYRRKGQVGKSVHSLKKAQRAGGRVDREEARATLSENSRGSTMKFLRWLGYAIILVVVFVFLRNRGFI